MSSSWSFLIFTIAGLSLLVSTTLADNPLDPLGLLNNVPSIAPLPSVSLPSITPISLPGVSLPSIPGVPTPDPNGGGFLSNLGLPGLPDLGLFKEQVCWNPLNIFNKGVCKPAAECKASGGFIGAGLCANLGSGCCFPAMKCGAVASTNTTSFTSPNYPNGTKEAGECALTIKKLPKIIMIRIGFEAFVLHEPNPTTGKCDVDAFWVEGVNPGFTLGKLCGINNGQHLYLPVSEAKEDSVVLKFAISQDNFFRKWWLVVDQIEATNPSLPPPGCAQYFTTAIKNNVLMSFNMNTTGNITGNGNIDGLKYAACIRQEVGFCRLQIEPLFYDMGPGTPNKFARALPAGSYSNRVGYARPRPVGGYVASSRPVIHYAPRPVPYAHQARPYAVVRPQYPALRPVAPKVYNYLPNVPMQISYQKPNGQEVLPAEVSTLLPGVTPKPLSPMELGLPTKKPTAPLNNVCLDEDILVMPPPDDGTSPIHCGKNFHSGKSFITSYPPFIIKVHNKGKVHGKGFAIRFKHEIC